MRYELPEQATTALPVMYRTYARKENSEKPRESVLHVKQRTLTGLFKLGNFTEFEKENIESYLYSNELFSSGRYMWCGGVEFSEKPENYYSLYNCSNITIESWDDLGHNFNFLMQGNGSGAKLEYKNIEKLPPILSQIEVNVVGKYGEVKPGVEDTRITVSDNSVLIVVGDSRKGWVNAYVALLRLASQTPPEEGFWSVTVDVSHVREKGSLIKGFGGVTNPSGFIPLMHHVIEITNGAVGRHLTPLEVSFLLNEAALCTVAGNVRRSARIDQFSMEDVEGALAKTGLWKQDENGNWYKDASKDVLRMANFTRVWHQKPTLDEIKEALEIQFRSGEGAIQYAPEAVARANADLLNTPELKQEFIARYCEDRSSAREMLKELLLLSDYFEGLENEIN
jgi:ribonucleotide reductase, class II